MLILLLEFTSQSCLDAVPGRRDVSIRSDNEGALQNNSTATAIEESKEKEEGSTSFIGPTE